MKMGRSSAAGVADHLVPLATRLLGGELALRLRGWDGSEAGPPGAPVLVVRRRRALRRLLWRPDELGLARAYVSGDLDIEGDVFEALGAIAALTSRENGPGLVLTGADKRALLRLGLRLRALGPPPSPPPEEARLGGRLHSRRRDASAVSHHYDVGNDFYRLVLGPSMVYTCAYWSQPAQSQSQSQSESDSAFGYGLDDAQRDKLDLVCRKLDLQPGMRLLDVGCGWGSLVLHAAQHYGVHAVGITVSVEQAELARKRVVEAGLADRVEIRVQDYRDVPDGPYDAIASVGMAEQVGEEPYPTYAAAVHDLLRPGGRLLNQQIAPRPGEVGEAGPSFIGSYVFPDGKLLTLAATVGAFEVAGLEVRDVQAMREHYTRTLRCWAARLEERWPEAVRLVGEGRARVWRLYMAGAALGFDAGRLGVNQVLAVRPHPGGRSGLPPTRTV